MVYPKMTACVLMSAVALVLVITPGVANADVTDPDGSSSFEFFDSDGFTLGVAPFTAAFTGGEAKSIGVPPLYKSGLNSFMIANGQTATIVFATPAEAVEFYVKQQASDVGGDINVFDADDNLLQSIEVTALTNDVFQNVALDQGSLGAAVDRITLTNNSTASTAEYLVIDDFSFRAIPEPVSAALLGVGGLVLMRRRR